MQAINNSGRIERFVISPDNAKALEKNFSQKLTNLFWNTEEGKPSEVLSELFSVLSLDLPVVPTIGEVVSETQAKWYLKKRWEIKEDTIAVQNKRENILPLLEKLKLTSSFCPEGHFDTALISGARANVFIARCYNLYQAVKNQEITLSQIDIVAGTHSLHPLELAILEESSLAISGVTTEAEMAAQVSKQILGPLGITCNVIVTDLKGQQPSAEQMIHNWLDLADRAGKRVLLVSDPQFAIYQYVQFEGVFQKRNISDISLELLSTQHEPEVFEELKISLKETQENPILLYLDTISKILFMLKMKADQGQLI